MTDSNPGPVANPDLPPGAGADAQQTSGAAPGARRSHHVLVPTLLVLATLIGTVAAFAVWVNRQALNTSNWSSTSSQILENKRVQTALSAYLKNCRDQPERRSGQRPSRGSGSPCRVPAGSW
jgi:hypothetical protein